MWGIEERSRQAFEAAALATFTLPLTSIDDLVEPISFEDECTADGER